MQASERGRRTTGRRLSAGAIAIALVAGLVATPAAAADVPSAPTTLSAEPRNNPGDVKLRWTGPAGPGEIVNGYLIEVSTDWDGSTGTFSYLDEARRGSARDRNVPCPADLGTAPPGTCAYRVRARNAAGVGAPSPIAVVEWGAPTQPRKLRVRSTDFANIDLTWNAPQTTGGLTLRYDLMVSPGPGEPWVELATDVPQTWYSAPGSCTSTVACSYRVVAKNAVGESLPTKPRHLKARPARVRKPMLQKVADDLGTGASTMELSWGEPRRGLYDEGYEIEICPGVCTRLSSPGWMPLMAVPAGQLSATVPCEPGLVSCTYRVRAVNRFGGTGVWAKRTHRPLAPYAVSADPGQESGTIDVSFYGPDVVGLPGMIGHFRFWTCSGGCEDGNSWTLDLQTMPYVSAIPPRQATLECPEGPDCMVRVQFVRSDTATSMVSAATGTTWDEDVPGQVTGLVAEPGPSTGEVELQWATPASMPALTGYEYRFRSDGGSFGPWVPTGSAVPSFVHGGCPTGTVCGYEVRAVNAIGPGAASNEATATPTGPPAAITDLDAEASTVTTGAVMLTWTAPGANPILSNYEYRVRIGGGSFGAWTSIGSTSTTYTHTACGAGNTCTYEVRAVNLLGPGPASNQASATAVTVTNGAPPQVSGFTVVTGSVTGTVDLSWDPVYTNPPITHYEYRVRIGGGGFGPWTSTGSTDPFFTFFCGEGVNCNFQLRAVNADGASSPSPNRGADGAP